MKDIRTIEFTATYGSKETSVSISYNQYGGATWQVLIAGMYYGDLIYLDGWRLLSPKPSLTGDEIQILGDSVEERIRLIQESPESYPAVILHSRYGVFQASRHDRTNTVF